MQNEKGLEYRVKLQRVRKKKRVSSLIATILDQDDEYGTIESYEIGDTSPASSDGCRVSSKKKQMCVYNVYAIDKGKFTA